MEHLSKKLRAMHRITDGHQGKHIRKGISFGRTGQNMKIVCLVCHIHLEHRLILWFEPLTDEGRIRVIYVNYYWSNNRNKTITVYDDGRKIIEEY